MDKLTADVREAIELLLPPADTISDLYWLESAQGGFSLATREWLERIETYRQEQEQSAK